MYCISCKRKTINTLPYDTAVTICDSEECRRNYLASLYGAYSEIEAIYFENNDDKNRTNPRERE